MLNDEICKLRDKLNKSIEDGEDYEVIYQLSIELDELITNYYEKKDEKQFATQLKPTMQNKILNAKTPKNQEFLFV